MRRFILLAGAAALAAGMPAFAQGQGKGKGGGGPDRQVERAMKQEAKAAQRAERREARGPDRAQRDASRAAERAWKEERKAAGRAGKQERQAVRQAQKQERKAMERGGRDGRNAFERAAREQRKAVERAEREQRRAGERFARDQRQAFERQAKAEERAFRDFDRDRVRDVRAFRDGIRPAPVVPAAAFGRHCPPGLAKQNAFCMPPGQLRKAQLIGQQVPVARYDYNIPDRYQYRFRDTDDHYYRYDEGHVYRIDRGSGIVSSVIPLLASGLLVGEPMPLGYEVYNVPYQYRGLYSDTADQYYRYDDGAIYQVDRRSGLVEGIVALLTSGALGGLGGLGIGDLLPSGYDAYNVPLQHRDTYYDTPDQMYRYADGNIYQVDPQTRLIEQIISLIA